MDDPNETLKVTMKVIRCEIRETVPVDHAEACLGLGRRCAEVDCGKLVCLWRINVLANQLPHLVAPGLWGLMRSQDGIANMGGREGR